MMFHGATWSPASSTFTVEHQYQQCKKDGERERDKAKYIMEEDGEEKSDSVEIKSTISITNFAKRNRKRGKEKSRYNANRKF